MLVFRVVVVLAIVAAFGQVSLGGVVRVTDSGLGCPDWPLCHGQLIPSFDSATLIEYSHRLSASLLTALVVATAAISWKLYRGRPWVTLPSALSLGLVIAAAALGAATVLTDLSWWFVLLHLGKAEMLIAALIVAVTIYPVERAQHFAIVMFAINLQRQPGDRAKALLGLQQGREVRLQFGQIEAKVLDLCRRFDLLTARISRGLDGR